MVAYSFKARFVGRIETGLRIRTDEDFTLQHPAKTQTIRAIGKRRHARPGENVQLYYAQRTKQCRQIGTGLCTSSDPCELNFKRNRVVIRGGGRVTHALARALNAFARADGFHDWDDLVAFWAHEHPGIFIFDGQLIRWSPMT